MESDDEASQGYLLGEDQDLTTHIPFSLERAGGIYAKLLVTPWNPVNSLEPNGTAGVDGWWVEFYFLDDSGGLLKRDANGAEVKADQGARVDSTPTDVIPLPKGTPYRIGVVVHMPAEAALPNSNYNIPIAIAFRDFEASSDSANGAGLEQSQGFEIIIDSDSDLSLIATPGVKPAPVAVITEPLDPPGPQAEGYRFTMPGDGNYWPWIVVALIVLLFVIRREIQFVQLQKRMDKLIRLLGVREAQQRSRRKPTVHRERPANPPTPRDEK